MEKVKIYGTVGPACKEPGVLKEMFREGMDGFRLNLSYPDTCHDRERQDPAIT